MTSKLLLLALFSFLIFLNGCKEDDAITYSTPRIKKELIYMDNNMVGEWSYRYDAAGRVVRKEVADKYYLQYSYLPGMVIIKTTIPDVGGFPAPVEDLLTDTLWLNDKGLQFVPSAYSTIEYDALGYLVKRIVHINKVPILNTFKIEDGNTVQWINRTGEQFENIAIDQRYEFLPNTTNTIGNENYGMTFYGKQDKNLRAKTTYISYSSSGTYESSESYSYDWDTRNRVVKRSTVGKPGNYSTYTYW